MQKINNVGMHILLDAYFDVRQPDSLKFLTSSFGFIEAMTWACSKNDIKVLGINSHHFGDGLGHTVTILLSESHASCHTWPEYGLATIDIYSCGDRKSEFVLNDFYCELKSKHNVVPVKKTEQKSFRGFIDERFG